MRRLFNSRKERNEEKIMRDENLIEDISNELIDLLIDYDDFDIKYDVEGFYLSIESQDVVNTINMLELNKKWDSLSNDDHLIIWDNIIDEYTIRYDNKNNKR